VGYFAERNCNDWLCIYLIKGTSKENVTVLRESMVIPRDLAQRR
jgi:hypothetical protein